MRFWTMLNDELDTLRIARGKARTLDSLARGLTVEATMFLPRVPPTYLIPHFANWADQKEPPPGFEPGTCGLQTIEQDHVNQCYFEFYDHPQARLATGLAPESALTAICRAWPHLPSEVRDGLRSIVTAFVRPLPP